MRRILVLTALLAVVAAPLPARASGIPTTGVRIALFASPESFPAETPFHVTQGFTCEAGEQACLSGLTHFDLYVDGRQLPSATDLTFGDDGVLLSNFNLTNFPSGLPAGTHTLHGEWYYVGTLVISQTVTVQFV